MSVFVLRMVNGPNWDDSRDRREQDGWSTHAEFMDRLTADGFVLLGGPVGDGREVLLAINAESEDAIRRQLAADPWARQGMLQIGEIRPWSIWLDGTGRTGK